MLARRRQQLPSLARSAAQERAVQTRLILAAERALEVQLARAIAAAGRRAATAHGTEAALAAAASAAQDIARVLRPAVAEIARTFGARVIQGPKSASGFLGIETKAFGDLDDAIRRHTASDTARRVVQISDSLRETIRRVIERAIAENLGQEETAALIVEATSGEIAMARARRIARTEIHNAAMFGQQAAAEASPLEFEKVWLSTEDQRTRESHAKANGQRVGLNDLFVLEQEDGRRVHIAYPGDTRAPPGEVINCRCVCLYEPILLDGPQPSGPQPGGVEVVITDDRPMPVQIDEPLPERDLEARPYERPELTLYASGDELNLEPDGTPRVGATVRLIGGNDLYSSPDAPEVDRSIARLGAGILSRPGTWFRRPVLWRITIPAGPHLPEGLFSLGGAGATVNSGVGRFGVVTMTVNGVSKTTWGQAAPKQFVEITDEFVRGQIENALRLLDEPHISAGEIAVYVGAQVLGIRRIDEGNSDVDQIAEAGAPDAVVRALRDTLWNKRSLRTYLQRLLDGDIQDEPGVGEPATDARVIVVDATMNIADAIVPQGEDA
jgi:hypothetical protein